MTGYIFEHHSDSAGDLTVAGARDYVRFRVGTGPVLATAALSREAALHLHNALGEWLYPTGVTLPQEPLSPADVRALVAAQVAEIMALHNSPPAKYVDASADSEPHDVGHPDPADRDPLPVRNPFASLVALMTGVREAQADMARLAAEALRPKEHPAPAWDDELFSTEDGWGMCPCTRAVPKGAECAECGHTRHLAKVCTARVRRSAP
jgi:hypothetical protein